MRLFGVVGGTRNQFRAAWLTIPFDLALATPRVPHAICASASGLTRYSATIAGAARYSAEASGQSRYAATVGESNC